MDVRINRGILAFDIKNSIHLPTGLSLLNRVLIFQRGALFATSAIILPV
jgi:hypothetical protein